MEFPSLGDLLISILSPDSQLFPPTEGIDSSILTNINFTFPLYSSSEIKNITKEMQSSKSIITPITSRYFQVPFMPEILEKLIQNNDFFIKNYQFISYFVLTSFIAWVIQMNDEISEEEILSLLNSLIKISIPSRAPIDKRIYSMGSAALYYTFEKILRKKMFSDISLFFKQFETYFSFFNDLPESTIQLFGLCMDCYVSENMETIPKTLLPLFSLISVTIVGYSGFISHATTESIITPIMYPISKLVIEALNLFSHLAPRLNEDFLIKCFTLFPNSIVNYLQQLSIKCPSPIPYEDRPELPNTQIKEVNYRIEEKQTFVNGINFKESFLFPERLELEQVLSVDLMSRLSLIIKATADNKKVVSILMESIEILMMKGKGMTFFFGLSATYLYLASKLHKFMNMSNTIRILLSTPFFHPCVTVFDNLEYFPIIDAMRSTIIEMIVREGFEAIDAAMQFWISQPPLFSEIIQRINRCITSSNLDFNPKNVNKFSKTLMSVSLYYQKMDFQHDDKFIETARKSIFLLISHLIDDKELTTRLFNCNTFISFFIPLVFEAPLRQFVLSNLLQFLSNNESTQFIVQTITQIFRICYTYAENEQYQMIISSLLQIVNDAIAHNLSNAKLFVELATPMLEALPKLSGTSVSKTLVLNIITFVSIIPVKLSSPQVSSIQCAISKTFVNEFPQVLSTKLLQLMSSEQLASFKPNFYIGQPRTLKLYLDSSMIDQQHTLQALSYLNELISSSAANAFAAHSANFDMHILNLLKEESKCDIEVTQSLLDLFFKIALEVSCVSVVHRMISLMSPISGRFIPKYQEQYLKTLINLLTASMRYPIGYLQINGKSDFIEVNGVTGEQLEAGFTCCMWVFIDLGAAQYKPPLITLIDTKGKKIKWFISGRGLFCTQRTTTLESSGHFEMKLATQEWIFLTMTYRNSPDGTGAQLRISQNLNDSKPLEFIPMGLEKGPIKCIIGNNTNDLVESQQNTRISAFGIWPIMKKEDISAVYQNGPSCSGPLPLSTIFAYAITHSEDDIHIIQRHQNTNNSGSGNIEITAQVSQECTKTQQTFINCLLRYCKVEMLLPLFAQFDMTFVNGERLESLSRLVIEAVGNALFANEEVQNDFHACHGFQIIVHILFNLSQEHITYSLYTQFYGMLQSMASIEMQRDLIADILLSVPVWLKCDPENHLKIIKHWTRVLIPSYKNIFGELLPVKSMLSIMRLYYWYEPTEKPQILGEDRFRGIKCDVSEIRQSLINAAIEIANVSFDESDFHSIESHCLTCNENKQVIDMLTFVEVLCNKYPHILKALKTDLTSFIYCLLTRQEPTILEHCVSILIAFHKAKLDQKITLTTQVLFIIQKLSPHISNESTFNFILDKMKQGTHELMPLICWMSLNMKDTKKYCRRIFTELTPSPEACYHVTWSIWPIILAFNTDTETTGIIFDFISRCAASQWNIIFCMINIIGRVLSIDASSTIAIFLMNVAQFLTSEKKIRQNEIEAFFIVTKFFLFFRSSGDMNLALQELFNNSVFNENSHKEAQKQERQENQEKQEPEIKKENEEEDEISIEELIDRPSTFTDKIMSIETLPQNYKFGLRLSKEGKWMDEMFVVFIISLFSRFDSRSFFDYDFLMCSFLIHTQPDVVKQHLEALKLTQEEIQSHNLFISLINHHAHLCNCKDVIKCNLSSDENAYLCLQRQQVLMDTSPIDLMNLIFTRTRKYFANTKSEMISIFSFTTDSLIAQSLQQISDYINNEKEKLRRNNHLWSLLWRSLAGDLAPWNCTAADEVFYKRDNTCCACLCPFKLKRDWKHDSHIQASIARDSGSKQTAIDKAELEKNKRMKQYMEQTPIELLVIKDVHQKDENIQQSIAIESIPCKVLAPSKEKDAGFIITKNSVRIEYKTGKVTVIPSSDIQFVFFRRRFHRPNALELITIYGKSYFIHFTNHMSLPIIAKFSTMHLPNISVLQTRDLYTFFKTNNKTDAWVNNTMSTFEYLMHLNTMSGRTFNDLAQYPVFPWIIADYGSTTFNPENPLSWRDLSKPIGAIGKERLRDILKRMPDLALLGERPYMYGSGYSCALTVCLFLIRTEPFTTLHIDLQSGRFDHASRIFSSIGNTWTMVSNHLSDYRELIPEFFFCPEFLENRNKFDLGETKNGSISEVELPKWSANAYDFIYLHRKALESKHVSENLNKWIDLIWGVTSRGELAKENYNMFKAEMYDEAWDEEALKSPRRRAEIEATLCHVGQVAPQLFFVPHPQRNKATSKTILKKPCVISLNEQINVVLATINRGEDNLHLMVSLCDAQGKYISCIVDFSSGNVEEHKETTIYTKEIKGLAELGFTTDPRQSRVADIQKGRFLVISPKTRRVHIVNFKNACVDSYPQVSNDCVSVSSNGEYSTFATIGSVLQIFRHDQLVSSIASYRESITCCYTSGTFNMSVFGTKDGFMLFSQIPSGEVMKVISLGEYRPQLVLITQQWGFVLLYATKIVDGIVLHYLLLYSVNGDLLRETKIECGVTSWSTYSSFDGFDYVCMGDEKGHVFVYEAFFLTPGEPACRCKSSIVSCKFFKKINTVVAVSSNGEIRFSPFIPYECITF